MKKRIANFLKNHGFSMQYVSTKTYEHDGFCSFLYAGYYDEECWILEKGGKVFWYYEKITGHNEFRLRTAGFHSVAFGVTQKAFKEGCLELPIFIKKIEQEKRPARQCGSNEYSTKNISI
jgi:hypothetical protein